MISRLILVAALASASSALAGGTLYGPFPVVDKTNCTTTGSPPITTCAPIAGVHYIVSAADYAANTSALAPYRDVSQANLQNVLAGDNASNPTMTVALTFPDQATATSVITQLSQ